MQLNTLVARPRMIYLLLCCILAFAFVWDWVVARRGHFALDQSCILDGAWRLYSGQVPYRDFLMPYAVTTCLLQWLGFEILGPTYDAYITVGALQNLVGCLLNFLIARRLLPGLPLAWLSAAAVSSLWFQAAQGTPWVDQTAFITAMVALLFVLESGRPEAQVTAWREIASGLCLSLTFLGKQNVAGLFAALLVGFLALRSSSPREAAGRIGRLLLGLGSGLAAWFLWLYLFSEPGRFIEAYLIYPSGNLLPRLAHDPLRSLLTPFIGWGNGLPRILSILVSLLCLWRLLRVRGPSSSSAADARWRSLAWMGLLLVHFQFMFLAVSLNQPETCYPFAGVIIALLIAFSGEFEMGVPTPDSIPGRSLHVLPVLLPLLLLCLMTGRGIQVSWTRRAQDLFRGSEFVEGFDRPGWRSMRWGKPHQLSNYSQIPFEDLKALVADLERRDENFFVWPDTTFLYAMLGRPSPQPLLFWWRGITSPCGEDEDLDRWIVSDLERNEVRVVVRELDWFGLTDGGRHLGEFPRLDTWMHDHFEEQARYGLFRVLVRKDT